MDNFRTLGQLRTYCLASTLVLFFVVPLQLI